jgi:hypothetical protein
MKKHGDSPVRKDMIKAARLLAGGAALLYSENPWLCQGVKEALAMSRKRKPPML